MPAGCEIFDGAGNLKLRLGDRLARLTQSAYTGQNSGYVDIPGTNTGTLFYIAVPHNYIGDGTRPWDGINPGWPTIDIGGSRIYWTYETPNGWSNGFGTTYNIPHTIFIGVR